MLWIESSNSWNEDACETHSLTPGSGTATVNCDCTSPGYVGVFLRTSNGTLVQIPEVYTFHKSMRFTISEDYGSVVGSGSSKADFLLEMKLQLADLLTTNVWNVRNLEASSGSVVVDYELVGIEDHEAGELAKSYDDLVKMFQDGKVRLYDTDGNEMDVPAQCVTSGGDNGASACEEKTKEDKVSRQQWGGQDRLPEASRLFFRSLPGCWSAWRAPWSSWSWCSSSWPSPSSGARRRRRRSLPSW